MHRVYRVPPFAFSLLAAGALGLAACGQPMSEEPAATEQAAMEEMPAAASPSADALLSDLTGDWEALRQLLMDIGDEMPAEQFEYKATPEVRSFAEQLMHVANAQVGLMARLDSSMTPPELPEATEKAAVLQALSDSFDFGADVLANQTGATILETVEGPSYLGTSTRARLVYRTIQHSATEYGVMTVYLRLNDLVPPASQ